MKSPCERWFRRWLAYITCVQAALRRLWFRCQSVWNACRSVLVCTVSVTHYFRLLWHTAFTCVKQRLPVSSWALLCVCLWCSRLSCFFLPRHTLAWPGSHPGFASWKNTVKVEYPLTSDSKFSGCLHDLNTTNPAASDLFVPLLSHWTNVACWNRPQSACKTVCCCSRAHQAANGGISF